MQASMNRINNDALKKGSIFRRKYKGMTRKGGTRKASPGVASKSWSSCVSIFVVDTQLLHQKFCAFHFFVLLQNNQYAIKVATRSPSTYWDPSHDPLQCATYRLVKSTLSAYCVMKASSVTNCSRRQRRRIYTLRWPKL